MRSKARTAFSLRTAGSPSSRSIRSRTELSKTHSKIELAGSHSRRNLWFPRKRKSHRIHVHDPQNSDAPFASNPSPLQCTPCSMPHAYALSLTHTHATLGLSTPMARRLPRGISAWNVALLSVSAACAIAYVIFVSTAATKSFALRGLEKRVEALNNDTLQLQDTLVTQSSLHALRERATELGFVPTERVAYLEISRPIVALAH